MPALPLHYHCSCPISPRYRHHLTRIISLLLLLFFFSVAVVLSYFLVSSLFIVLDRIAFFFVNRPFRIFLYKYPTWEQELSKPWPRLGTAEPLRFSPIL